MRFCNKCGVVIKKSNQKFCSNCGAYFDKDMKNDTAEDDNHLLTFYPSKYHSIKSNQFIRYKTILALIFLVLAIMAAFLIFEFCL